MNRMKTWLSFGFAATAAFALASCGGDSESLDYTDGDKHQSVINAITVPQTAAQKDQLGLDLDGNGRPDNALGGILAVLAENNVDTQGQVDAAVASGDVIILSELTATSLTDENSVAWQVYLGADAPSPDFSGSGTFMKASDSPTNAVIQGQINGGKFTVNDPASISLRLSIVEGGEPITIDLVGARIEGTVSETACNVKIGGAITKSDLDTKILPEIVDIMNGIIAADPTTMTAMTMLDLFDTNPTDGTITLAELQGSPLIGALLAPDVDLLDSSGNYDPGVDGEKDALSMGIGATCVKATF